ncbi:MAG: YlmC/YmxH family sporulation protein [Bacilli bacterium]
MCLSELQSKDVININDGKRIGTIVDARIEDSTGKIVALVIESKKGVFGFLSNRPELEVFWDQIVKIGEDIILVKLVY